MIADEAIVDPRAIAEVVSLASGALNGVGDSFYILNAEAHLRGMNKSERSEQFLTPLSSAGQR